MLPNPLCMAGAPAAGLNGACFESLGFSLLTRSHCARAGGVGEGEVGEGDRAGAGGGAGDRGDGAIKY